MLKRILNEKEIIATAFIIIATIDVFTQYTPLNVFGLRLNIILTLIFIFLFNSLLKIKLRIFDIAFLLVITLSMAVNYNNYSYSNFEYLKIYF